MRAHDENGGEDQAVTEMFDRLTPVLDYEPNCCPVSYAQGRRWLLWPALAYRVVAPVPRERRFNLFQEYVLKLCQAGVMSAKEIGQRLGFGTELAAYIVIQLQNLGLLDSDGVPTRRAIRELEEDQEEAGEPVAGYIFVDPFTGTVWPRFMVGALRKVEVTDSYWDRERQAMRMKFSTGPVGKPLRGEATAVSLKGYQQKEPVRPSAYQVLAACRQHIRQRRHYERTCRQGGGQEDAAGRDVLPRQLGCISVLGSDPQPVFLLTFLFVPRDVVRTSLWQVCDPFGLGLSVQLRQQIEGLVQQDRQPALRADIEELTGRSFAIDELDLSELIAAQHRVAAAAVEGRLGTEVRVPRAAAPPGGGGGGVGRVPAPHRHHRRWIRTEPG